MVGWLLLIVIVMLVVVIVVLVLFYRFFVYKIDRSIHRPVKLAVFSFFSGDRLVWTTVHERTDGQSDFCNRFHVIALFSLSLFSLSLSLKIYNFNLLPYIFSFICYCLYNKFIVRVLQFLIESSKNFLPRSPKICLES